MIRRLSKKGEEPYLMRQVLSVIVFVLTFLLVAFAVYKVYAVFSNQETKNVQNTLEKITSKIKATEAGESTTVTLQGFGNGDSAAWGLFAWNAVDPVESKPDKCYFNSCICLCKNPSKVWTTSDAQLTSCKQSNLCETFDYDTISIVDESGNPRYFAGTNYYSLPTNIDQLTILNSVDGNSLTLQYVRVNQ